MYVSRSWRTCVDSWRTLFSQWSVVSRAAERRETQQHLSLWEPSGWEALLYHTSRDTVASEANMPSCCCSGSPHNAVSILLIIMEERHSPSPSISSPSPYYVPWLVWTPGLHWSRSGYPRHQTWMHSYLIHQRSTLGLLKGGNLCTCACMQVHVKYQVCTNKLSTFNMFRFLLRF